MTCRILQNNIGKTTVAVLIAISFAMLSFYQMIQMEKWMIITVLTSFICGFYFFRWTGNDNILYIKSHPFIAILILFLSTSVLWQEYLQKGSLYYDMIISPLPFHFFRFRYWILALPALSLLWIGVWRISKECLTKFWGGVDSIDKKI